MHTNDRRVLRVDPVVLRAMRRCRVFWTEVDFRQDVAGALRKAAALSEDKALEELLPSPLLARARAELARRGRSLAPFASLKPWVLWFVLEGGKTSGVGEGEGAPMDMRLAGHAERMGLLVGGVEAPGEQFAAFDALTLAEQRTLLQRSLDHRDAVDEGETPVLERLIQHYLRGDVDALHAHALRLSGVGDAVDARLAELLLTRRNERMAARLIERRSHRPDEGIFLAVGAAHLGGERGLIALLRAAGHRVERIHRGGLQPLPPPVVCPPKPACPPKPVCRPKPTCAPKPACPPRPCPP